LKHKVRPNHLLQSDPFDKAQGRPFDAPFASLKACFPRLRAGQARPLSSTVRCKIKVIAMEKPVITLILILISSFCFAPYSFAKSASAGTIRGYVLLPKEIDMATVPKEAKVYIYLNDYTPVHGKEVLPWDAPIKKVIERHISSLKSHKVAFEFRDLPEGLYGVSVLVDTGRPHVPHGSLNFTAFPGDYAGGTRDNLKVEHNQTIEVSINEGMYVTIPEGYEAPLYSPE
jgi:hypothetical protein